MLQGGLGGFSKILLRRFPGRSAPTAVREPEPCGDLNICNAKTSSSKTCVYKKKEKITRNVQATPFLANASNGSDALLFSGVAPGSEECKAVLKERKITLSSQPLL